MASQVAARGPAGLAVDLDMAAVAGPIVGGSSSIGAVAEGLRDVSGRNRRYGLVGSEATAQQDLDRAVLVADGVDLARRLANAPPNVIDPRTLADVAVAIALREGLDVEVIEPGQLEAESMGGLLAIGRGSNVGPRMVGLHHRPSAATRFVALVGKGITFDSGGLSLKDPDGIMDMKLDMAGAAAVLAAMSVVSRLDVEVGVSAWLPLAENMPSSTAVRVGDVVTTRNGTTVEVRNTDFEGRVVMADALARASEDQPDLLVDLATLTHACTLALGGDIGGVLGNDATAVGALVAAAARAGEPVWTLPLDHRYADRLGSDVADVSNHPGNATGRAITAALFLHRFVGPDIPWVHLDMVGPAWRTGPGGGATGFGVRTLLELLRHAES
ncbi:M17 family metallopeptidase [Euzebya rosea]|uniref:M17 family metallopeptidase n=1 Tax=Euzebya rosea TaxID=2052804 RepID=UPI001300B1CB|nr:leucyl aminopeptidase family protein [Euzebya rosea]